MRIDATSVATQDSERDTTLAGGDWFDTPNFAQIIFSANRFEHLADDSSSNRISSSATLEIRGTSYPIQFDFSVSSEGNQRTLHGTATLDRLALNLGTQEWADTEWVGQFVQVEVVVQALVLL